MQTYSLVYLSGLSWNKWHKIHMGKGGATEKRGDVGRGWGGGGGLKWKSERQTKRGKDGEWQRSGEWNREERQQRGEEAERNAALQPKWAAPLCHSTLLYDSPCAYVRGCASVRHASLFVTAVGRVKVKDSGKIMEGWNSAGWKRWGIQGLWEIYICWIFDQV